jgi:1,4-dihydroxy-2-naphthoyl-CoA hydrolase
MRLSGVIEFVIAELSTERVTGTMPIQAGILNPFGIVHAGAMLWFADVCATILVAGKTDFVPESVGFPLGINLQAALLGNQGSGEFRAISVFVKRGRRLSVVRTTIIAESGRLIADVSTSHIPAL